MDAETRKATAAYLRAQAEQLDPTPEVVQPTPVAVGELFNQIGKINGNKYASVTTTITRYDSGEYTYDWNVYDSIKREIYSGITFQGALNKLADDYANSADSAEQAAALIESAIDQSPLLEPAAALANPNIEF